MNTLNYQETLQNLHSIPRRKKENDLKRMERFMELLGNPQNTLRCVHVAGTNGKGSVSKMIAHSLTTSGYTAGLFTSPYIIEFRERIAVNGDLIKEEEVIEYYSIVQKGIETLLQEDFGHPSEFEVVTAMAFMYFKEKNVDICVIEVGIGGRYDATNVLFPILSVITSISKDHVSQLGDTLREIAFHKAGIIKSAPVIASSQKQEVREVLDSAAAEKKTDITFIEPAMYEFLELEGSKQKICLRMDGIPPFTVRLNLLGTYQLENAATSVKALLTLQKSGYQKLTVESIKKSLETVTWIGRMEVVHTTPFTIMDGAHNEDGASRLVESIQSYFPQQRILLLLGMLKDKDVSAVTKLLAGAAAICYLHTPDDFRALPETELASYIPPGKPYFLRHTVEEAYKKAVEDFTEGDLILSTGSLYTIGDMRTAVENTWKADTKSV
ncbi:dihydrofolate synthase / folylpolyglutamate synthase [Proteiniclasticum ruminis]|uniref:tetrahydrofolate synthase n=2 Tax=Proteiniclasticum ruminis TaxID=398199 RepID=A0A1G8N9W7_9CLOT|nr:dihydrofolate synthase / folylpolyglutamate synthase [Proteiniclasticum ruminis]